MLKDMEVCRFQKGNVVFSFSITFKHLQTRWNSPRNIEVQIERYITARPYKQMTTVSSRICNYCRYNCIDE